jgi:hypothetical protein
MKEKRPTFVPAPKQVKHNCAKPTYMTNFDYPDPDTTHSLIVPNKQSPSRIPQQKTEEEIDRQWEYLKMMGKGGTR